MVRASVEIREINRGMVAGAVGAFAAVTALLLIAGTRSGASSEPPGAASMGEARSGQLTVAIPAAFSDRIYASPSAAGRPIVVIDAGHGGSDPGAISVTGELSEKQLTLALAKELRDKLVERGRVRVAMTRDDDRYLGLEERAGVARRLGAGLFVSLHIDSAPNPLARGATVYSLSDVASDAEAQRFAAAENHGGAADRSEGTVNAMLADLAMRDQMSASADLAARIVGKSAGRLELRPQPHKFAAFHVLRRADTPAVLVEAGYISNADDELLLRNPDYRSKLVLALAQAIETDIAARSRH